MVDITSTCIESCTNSKNSLFLKNFFDHAREGMMITDSNKKILSVNHAFSIVTGYKPEEVIGKSPSILKSGVASQNAEFYAKMWDSIEKVGGWSGEICNKRKDGSLYFEKLSISKVYVSPEEFYCVGIFTDISELKSNQEFLLKMAHHDALTGLPNRAFLTELVDAQLKQAGRTKSILAICYLDLDEFKPVNDVYGHLTGDLLLKEVAQRLRYCLRDSDIIARLGGDEFVFVLTNLGVPEESDPIIDRILRELSQPYFIQRESLTVSASIGVSFFPNDGEDSDLLFRRADQAMYAAKQSGKNRYHLFDRYLDHKSREYHEAVLDIKRGIENREFILYYQPQVNMTTNKVTGVEALVRWNHPTKGILSPAEFMDYIDESVEMSITLGNNLIKKAIADLDSWRQHGLELKMGINVSVKQLYDEDFISFLNDTFYHYPSLNPNWIDIEVLETSAVNDFERMHKIMSSGKNLGVSFSIDDFGTGYSSLVYLKKLPIKTLKIDRSFTSGILEDPDDLMLVEGVINLAKSFGKELIAEGVETVDQGIHLIRLGCEIAQGYFVSKPMTEKELLSWIKNYHGIEEWQHVRYWPSNRRLLSMKVEFRKWIYSILDYTIGSTNNLSLDKTTCVFSNWIKTIDDRDYKGLDSFTKLCELHDEMHVIGIKLVEAKKQNKDFDYLDHRLREILADILRNLEVLEAMIENRMFTLKDH